VQPSRWFFRERSLSKVAAVYDHLHGAELATARVKALAGVDDRRIQVVCPGDADAGRKVEPEGIGIARTAIRAHATCAVAGIVVASVLWTALRLAGLPLIVSTPGTSLFALTLMGAMFGLMAGGALTLRPDHDLVNAGVSEASRAGRWSVVVHPVSRRELERSADALAGTGVPVLRTL
jgi:hypothetical protein